MDGKKTRTPLQRAMGRPLKELCAKTYAAAYTDELRVMAEEHARKLARERSGDVHKACEDLAARAVVDDDA